MFASEIDSYLKNNFPSLHKYFLGPVPSNRWPKTINRFQFFISNLSPINHRGTHWCLIICDGNNDIELFDCLKPCPKIIQKLKKYKRFVRVNNFPVMSVSSKLCGQYCIFYVVNRCFNPHLDMNEIFQMFFSKNKKDNDRKVKRFMDHFMN